MSSILTITVVNSIATLLTEAYAGPPDPRGTWFIDNESDSGVLGILRNVTAEEASHSMDGSGKSGTTIASHAEHLRWSLAAANTALRGEPYPAKWSESWGTVHLSEEEWKGLREALQREYETLQTALKRQTSIPDEESLIGLMSLLPHAAYHLGNLRQMVERVRERQPNRK